MKFGGIVLDSGEELICSCYSKLFEFMENSPLHSYNGLFEHTDLDGNFMLELILAERFVLAKMEHFNFLLNIKMLCLFH